MVAVTGFARKRAIARLPTEVYAALVDSLYQNFTSMFAGVICATGAMMLTAWRVQWWPLWLCAAAILIVGSRLLWLRAVGKYTSASS
mgnify:CR=1 FL=1